MASRHEFINLQVSCRPDAQVLSRAFRSRFLELHVGDIPDGELATILEGRCALAPSYAAKLVAVMRALQRRRQACALHCWQTTECWVYPQLLVPSYAAKLVAIMRALQRRRVT